MVTGRLSCKSNGISEQRRMWSSINVQALGSSTGLLSTLLLIIMSNHSWVFRAAAISELQGTVPVSTCSLADLRSSQVQGRREGGGSQVSVTTSGRSPVSALWGHLLGGCGEELRAKEMGLCAGCPWPWKGSHALAFSTALSLPKSQLTLPLNGGEGWGRLCGFH